MRLSFFVRVGGGMLDDEFAASEVRNVRKLPAEKDLVVDTRV